MATDDEAIEGALRASGCEVGAYNYVKKMLSLNQQLQQNKGGNANSSSNRSQADILDWADRLYGQSVDLITKTAKHLLSGERQLPIAAAVEALLANQPSSSSSGDVGGDAVVDTFAYFDAKASASQRASVPLSNRSSHQDEHAGGYASAVAFVSGGVDACYACVDAHLELNPTWAAFKNDFSNAPGDLATDAAVKKALAAAEAALAAAGAAGMPMPPTRVPQPLPNQPIRPASGSGLIGRCVRAIVWLQLMTR